MRNFSKFFFSLREIKRDLILKIKYFDGNLNINKNKKIETKKMILESSQPKRPKKKIE
jgi:hypothetical protein